MTSTEEKRIQASNCCISIFKEIHKGDLHMYPESVIRAWEIGLDITNIVLDKEIDDNQKLGLYD